MIRFNFIPEQMRKDRSGLLQGRFGTVPREILLGIGFAVVGLLVLFHLTLVVISLRQSVRQNALEIQWKSMAADKKIYDDVKAELDALQKKMDSLKKITDVNGPTWSKIINEISKSVPKGGWIRQITFEGGRIMISGSVVSKVKSEMVVASDFVTKLKQKPSFQAAFTDVEIDSIQRREDTMLSIADLSVKAKRK